MICSEKKPVVITGLKKKRGNRFLFGPSIHIASMILFFLLMSCGAGVKGDRILFDFEHDGELDGLDWKCYTLLSLSRNHVTHGEKSLKMELYPSDYPQMLTKTDRNDWSGFGGFSFDVYNAEEREVNIYVRIDDRKDFPQYGDRFSKIFTLQPGQNRITIPFDTLETENGKRRLDTGKIYRLFIFMEEIEKKVVLYVDYMRLVRRS